MMAPVLTRDELFQKGGDLLDKAKDGFKGLCRVCIYQGQDW